MPEMLPEPILSTMQALVAGLLTILGPRLAGVYLGGSLTMGDFLESSSDLDFLVVTEGVLSQEDALAVALLHKDLLRAYPYAARLEGDYAPRSWLSPHGTTAPVPGCERGVFLPRVGEIMLSSDNIYNLREQGIALYGPAPAEIFPPVTREEVREAVRQMLAVPCSACETPAEAACELLNMLRSASAIENGVPTTKTDGAHFMLTHLDKGWHPAIHAALAIRQGDGTDDDDRLVRQSLPELHHVLKDRYC